MQLTNNKPIWFRGQLILKLILILVGFGLLTPNLIAQTTGKITGTVVDSETGEAMIGANVYIDGTTLGAATDLDGKYLIEGIMPGEYNLIFSTIGYSKSTITGIKVKAGDIVKLDFAMQLESIETEEVVISAQAALDSDAGMLINRQKSLSVSDAISAEQISKSGAGDAADAVKKVVGATVVGGKYVYIRGLGERYSSTQLNGAELPSSDPNKKAFQLDLLPTNLLDNIITLKTFTPDKPGNFSGGIVDVGTKNFPTSFILKLSSGTSYNSQATFNDNYLTFSGANGDFLGFNDGTFDLPENLDVENLSIPLPQQARFNSEAALKLDEYSKSFNNVMDFTRASAPVNQSYSISVGDQISTGENSSLGYLGSLTYSRNYSFYEDGKVQRYIVADLEADELNPQLLLNDQKSSSESNLGGLFTVNYKFSSHHQFGGNIFYSRSGIAETRFQEGTWPQEFGLGEDTPMYFNRVLSYSDRDILSYQIRGEHNLTWLLNTTVDWNTSISNTTQIEPDRRLISSSIQQFSDGQKNYIITGSGFDDPSRYFRELEDKSNSYNLNFSIPFSQWNNKQGKLKFGASHQTITRNFIEKSFSYTVSNQLYNLLDGSIVDLFSLENLGISRIDTLSNGNLRYNFANTINNNSKAKNNYDGEQDVTAFYGMVELPLINNIKFIGGLRYETTDMKVTSKDPVFPVGKISEKDLLHSLNLIYEVAENMNLRLASTKTLARPNFREIAPYATKEFINDVELQGNPNLKRTLIDNYDIRLEWFARPGEIIAISGFYKNLENPIELAFAEGATRSNPIVNYVNVGNAIIYGVEFESRFRLDWFSESFSNFSIGANLSLVSSKVDIDGAELAQRIAIDENSPSTRSLQGQSPFIFNFDLSYENYETGTLASLNFNTFGERLSRVSANVTPDVYEQPAAQLDFIFSQKLLEYFKINLSVKNIMNSNYREIYKYKGEEFVYQEYKRGISYAVGLSYEL